MTFRRNSKFMDAIRSDASARLARATELVRVAAVARLDRGGESEPGQSPVSDTGELRDSLRTYPPVDRENAIEAGMGTDLYKLVFIERGTASMQPRPLLYPSMMDAKPDVMRLFAQEAQA